MHTLKRTQFYLAILCSCLLSLTAEAKKVSDPIKSKKDKAYIRLQGYIGQSVGNQSAAKKFRSNSRLIYKRTLLYNMTNYEPWDSTQYSYNSTFGYDPTPEKFDYLYFNTYLYGNNADYYDKSKQWDVSSTPLLTDSTTVTFDAAHRMLNNRSVNVTSSDFYSTTFAYNAAGKKIKTIDSQSFGGINAYQSDFNLNSLNKVVQVQNYDNGVYLGIDSLFYDVEGKLIQVKSYEQNQPVYKMDILYNAQNLVAELIYSDWDVTNWIFSDKEMFNYNAANNRNATYYWFHDGVNWVMDSKDTLTYSLTATYPIQQEYFSFDIASQQWQPNYKIDYTYNVFNQVLTETQESWNGSSYDPGVQYTYHYEYLNPTSTNTAALTEAIQVYPNPANDNLFVKTSGVSGQFETRIVNMQGQVIQSEQHEAQNAELRLDISSLKSGNYILQVITASGKELIPFTKNN